ncbi:putative membrane protein (TIGR02226 family) [Aquimarina sp. MAR_2010_214]|uniref:BatA domain-containing protein n=1 Tax=Aquimarina sp. MAR_2010_214 TaxID=1250026 RepID=UPI000C7102E8|nr:BatA domain-containing protein [Aquimarina sp. MAR_2010_214]PKV51946.1 putative membrane protein (TIGR02226 family) [Aquimarina sp. MAR_2010_214]
MFFLNPTYLWALLGLIVPIVIHLWSKKEGKTIKIGSIQLLDESDSKQTSSIQINELWLLLLRILLIGILVFLIAGPQIKRKITKVPVTYIVEPSLVQYEEVSAILDTIGTEVPIRLLQSGFPEYQNDPLPKTSTITPKYWQLAKEMETLETDSIVVFTNAFTSGIKGKRPRVHKNISWIILDPGKPIKNILSAVKKENTIEFLSVSSDDQHLSFDKELVAMNSNQIEFNKEMDSVIFLVNGKQEQYPLITESPVRILVFYEDNLSNEKAYVEAAYNALSKYLNKPIDVHTVQNSDTIHLDSFKAVIWLSKDVIPKTSSTVLLYKPDDLSHSIIEKGPSKDVFYLTKPLNTEHVVNEYFAEHLLAMLNLNENLEEKIRRYDKRVLHTGELLPIAADFKQNKENATILDISRWLWLLLILLLITERIVAKYRKQ